jgi:hypothetical protein
MENVCCLCVVTGMCVNFVATVWFFHKPIRCAETCPASRCLAMKYSGFQASCPNINGNVHALLRSAGFPGSHQAYPVLRLVVQIGLVQQACLTYISEIANRHLAMFYYHLCSCVTFMQNILVQRLASYVGDLRFLPLSGRRPTWTKFLLILLSFSREILKYLYKAPSLVFTFSKSINHNRALTGSK